MASDAGAPVGDREVGGAGVLRLHVYPHFGDRPIGRQIRPGEIQATVQRLGQTLAPSTVEVVYGRVVAVFRAAVRDRVIPVSPCVDVRRPASAPASTLQVLTSEQVVAIADEVPAALPGAGGRRGRAWVAAGGAVRADSRPRRTRRHALTAPTPVQDAGIGSETGKPGLSAGHHAHQGQPAGPARDPRARARAARPPPRDGRAQPPAGRASRRRVADADGPRPDGGDRGRARRRPARRRQARRSTAASSTTRARSTTSSATSCAATRSRARRSSSQIAGLEHLGALVRATHERWDGNGYPDGIAGTDIPLEARIVGCADAFDAMVSDRAYRQALERRARRAAAIERDAGRQFDPLVAAALLEIVCDEPLEERRSARPTASGSRLAALGSGAASGDRLGAARRPRHAAGWSGSGSASSAGIRAKSLAQRVEHRARVERRGRVEEREQPHARAARSRGPRRARAPA